MNLVSAETRMIPVDSAPTILLTGVTTALLVRGFSPYIGENGNWFVYDAKTASFVDTGVGSGGYVPKRGVDYWTAADKQEINQYIEQQVKAQIAEIMNHAIMDSTYVKTT